MTWAKPVDTSDLLAELDYATERLRDAARDIRYCQLCASTWRYTHSRDGYDQVRRCACFAGFVSAMSEFKESAKSYAKATNELTEPPPEAFVWHRKQPPPYASDKAFADAHRQMFGIGSMPEMEEVW